MQIKDLEPRQGNVNITLDVSEVGDAREFEKFGKKGKVATAKAKDETGEIKLSLWNEQVDLVKPGSKVQISNGYVSEYQGENQLTTGKFGKLEILESGSGESPTPSADADVEKKPEPVTEESSEVVEEKIE